jgi:hypothetical protein
MASGIMFTLVGDGDEANVVVFVPGEEPMVAHSSHPNFNAIVQAAQAQDYGVVDLFDIASTVAQKFERLSDRISTANGELFLDGEPMNGVIVDAILRSMQAGLNDWQPLVLFIEKLETNPNPGSVDQLYSWLKSAGLTIDTNGDIVGYKGVEKGADGSLRSVRSGKAIVNGEVQTGQIGNGPGDVVEMPRSEVQYDPAVGCSTGLHVGSYEYASGWARGALLEVRVNPRDVVSVPTDCNAEKLRVCRYTVVDLIDQPYTEPVIGSDYEESDLYDDFDLWGDFEYGEEVEYDPFQF